MEAINADFEGDDFDMQSEDQEFEAEDLEEQWEEQEFSAEEFEEIYQMAMRPSPENPEQEFSKILQHRRSKLREQYGWFGGPQ